MAINAAFPYLFHGGDYSPDQWPDATQVEDVRLMGLARANMMSVAIFSWATLEVREGEFVGEGVLLMPAPHMATVTSETQVTLLELSREALEGFLEQHGDMRDSFRQTLDHRLRWARTRRLRPAHPELADILMDVVGELDPTVVASLEHELRWETLPQGAILMRQGEVGDCLYLVVSGRLRVFGERDDGSVVETPAGSEATPMAMATMRIARSNLPFDLSNWLSMKMRTSPPSGRPASNSRMRSSRGPSRTSIDIPASRASARIN